MHRPLNTEIYSALVTLDNAIIELKEARNETLFIYSKSIMLENATHDLNNATQNLDPASDKIELLAFKQNKLESDYADIFNDGLDMEVASRIERASKALQEAKVLIGRNKVK
jgi:hypothetical protein